MRTNFFCARAVARPVHRAQVRKRAHRRAARHRAALRNSRQQSAHGRMPSAARAHRARRNPLQRSSRRLPHRDPRSDENPDREERDHRPVRRQGRLHRQAASAPAAEPNRRRRGVQDADQRDARSHRQSHRRRPGASCARQGARQRRSVSGRGRRQRHREFLRHRQSNRDRARLLAGRRVRVRRRARLRPQEDGDHGARRVGIRSAASARDGPRLRPRHADHDDWHRRHVGRRVRQRPPAIAQLEAHRRVRPSPHLHRPESRPGGELRRTQAALRSAALELGRLQSPSSSVPAAASSGAARNESS